jgi:hypothetical protein
MGTFHLFSLLTHLIEALLVSHNLLNASSYLVFQAFHFLSCFSQFVDLLEVLILVTQITRKLFGMSLDIFLSLVLHMIDF